MRVKIESVRIQPNTTFVRVYPDLDTAMRIIAERPHMRDKIEQMLRDGMEVRITVRPKD